MGRQPLSAAPGSLRVGRLACPGAAWQQVVAYAAHDDPLVAAYNLIVGRRVVNSWVRVNARKRAR
jgi:hypothetical protein